MTAVVLLLFGFRIGAASAVAWGDWEGGDVEQVARSSSLLGLIFFSIWIPDTREVRWFGIRTGELHTRMAIIAIPFMACGIVLDGIALRWMGARTRTLWPFHLYGLIVVFGGLELMAWEKMCRRNAALHHWPGDGIHSTPLWEWIVFAYLIGFMAWMAHGRLPVTNDMNPSKQAPPRWRRWLKRTVQIGGLGLVVVALATLRPVTHEPWVQTEPAVRALADAGT